MDCSAFRVVALDPGLQQTLARQPARVHYWPDPRTRQLRPYLLLQSSSSSSSSDSICCEMQSMSVDAETKQADSSFASFLVKDTYLMAQSQLYVITPMDPLFLLLPLLTKSVEKNVGNSATTTTTSTDTLDAWFQQQTWQPLEQLMSSVSHPAVSQSEPVKEFCKSMAVDDDTAYYKFEKVRILQWLTKKQTAVLQVLTQQCQQEEEEGTSEQTSGEGAFCSGFVMTQEEAPKQQQEASSSAVEQEQASRAQKHATRLEHESIQVVCNYLDTTWQQVWLDHLQKDHDTVFGIKKAGATKKRKLEEPQGSPTTTATVVSTESDEYMRMSKPQPSAPKEVKPISAGAKRLAKVNTKGMKKMSAFFQKKM